jgi:hypothetical protein
MPANVEFSTAVQHLIEIVERSATAIGMTSIFWKGFLTREISILSNPWQPRPAQQSVG